MSADDWKYIFQMFGALGVGSVVVGAVAYFAIKTSISSYFSEKGKNLATKEDIGQITRIVEDVKSELQARHTLRFAALDKRLDTHQQAYTHVMLLISSFFSEREKIREALNQCRTWHAEHALFLEARAKAAFDAAFKATSEQVFRKSPEGYKLPSEEENYQTVLNALDEITQAVGLPPLKGDLPNLVTPDRNEIGNRNCVV